MTVFLDDPNAPLIGQQWAMAPPRYQYTVMNEYVVKTVARKGQKGKRVRKKKVNDYELHILVLNYSRLLPYPSVPQESEHCVGEYLNSQQVPDRRIAWPNIRYPDAEADAFPPSRVLPPLPSYPFLSPEMFRAIFHDA